METLTHYSSSNHVFLEEYNTTKIIFKNGVEKVKRTSFSIYKGLNKENRHNGTLSESDLEYKCQKYLKKVRSDIINLAFNYSDWEYFITLTFDFRKIGEYSHEKAIDLLKKWINNQKHQNRGMTYLLVPEFHKQSGHLHFHGLIANVPKWEFEESRYATTGALKKINGLQIYNLKQYKLGFVEISKIQDQERVSNYISKYATKELIDLKNKKRYWYSRNLEKPKVEYSFLENNLAEYYQENDLSYLNTFEKSNCYIQVAQTNQLPIIE